jgi:hypothetical protein
VYVPKIKELHYFSRNFILKCISGPGDDIVTKSVCRTFIECEKLFNDVKEERSIGEASPSYFYFAECIDEIKNTLGNEVKIIILIRNPTARAFSNYLHLIRERWEKLTFFEALQKERIRMESGWGDFSRYADHSLYASRLAKYFAAFDRKNIKLIIFEELAANTAKTVKSTFEFLGVNPEFVPSNLDTTYNYKSARASMIAASVLSDDRFGRMIERILFFTRLWKYREIIDNLAKISISEEASQFLNKYFENDILRSENLLNLNLNEWKGFKTGKWLIR